MLPREIQTENWPDRAKYDLPIRPIGVLRWAGILPMAFSLVFIAFPAKSAWQSLLHAMQGAGKAEWVAVAFLSVFVAAGMIPFALGLFILAGRVRLVSTKEKLVVTEIAGPFRWSRRFPIASIERIEVGARADRDPNAPGALGGLLQLSGMAAVMKNGPTRLLVLGYPSDWLSALAEELSEALRREGASVSVKEVSFSLRPTAPAPEEENLTQPPQSNIRLVTTGGGIELTAPSRGFFKDSAGLALFGVFWCGLLVLITAGFLFGTPSPGSHGSLGKTGGVLVFTLFWAVGLVLLSIGVHLGTRRWTVQADKSLLQISQRSALRRREWKWSPAEIEKVQVGDSNMEVNHRRLEELQVFPRGGKKTGFLVGRDRAELVWMATVIRQALGLRAKTTSDSVDE